MQKPRYYADLNPAFGAWQEQRWVVFDRETGHPVPRAIVRQYASRPFAEGAAARLNKVEEACQAAYDEFAGTYGE